MRITEKYEVPEVHIYKKHLFLRLARMFQDLNLALSTFILCSKERGAINGCVVKPRNMLNARSVQSGPLAAGAFSGLYFKRCKYGWRPS